MAATLRGRHRAFGGWLQYHSHVSAEIGGEMRLAVYLPPAAERGRCRPSSISPA